MYFALGVLRVKYLTTLWKRQKQKNMTKNSTIKANITLTDRRPSHDTTSKSHKTQRPHDSHNTTKAKQSSQGISISKIVAKQKGHHLHHKERPNIKLTHNGSYKNEEYNITYRHNQSLRMNCKRKSLGW